MRRDGRGPGELREVRIVRDFLKYPGGSALIEMGDTRVICSATVVDEAPPFLKGTGRGWLTGEYAMLPAATAVRSPRESLRGRVGGRTHEIQRLIGRSLRAVTDLGGFGERTIHIDCDVIQADGGTRTAAITGAFVALVDLLRREGRGGDVFPVADYVSAVSVGVVDGEILLDLDYAEDSRAEVDMNVVMTGGGRFVEVQGTAERSPFAAPVLQAMLAAAAEGIGRLTGLQREILGDLR
ncbi:MAG TPA: ribonuclease PH [Syntrophales bacterium]|nr:ribonuclease PH [Syntrophales bacterium]HOM08103.1 ribonuclease PH [Syntrophales bacterium]HON98854.1 ribonuclease PH [Syntrophales bacterium]HPC00886.1 ribonuclease PH [Syntrophales bacterium]HPQ07530.1 ribonuclease PH [Syntrophales bacterium]